VALCDGQYYYKITRIEMDQFGVNMTFLGIKQVSVIIFVLKIIFSINFYDFPIHWTTPQLHRNAGANSEVFLRLKLLAQGLRVGFPKI
jgi:hypothetical protein